MGTMKDGELFSFEKLEVWQLSRSYSKKVYLLIRSFPLEERFELSDQLRRSAISVPSNIAEGLDVNSIAKMLTVLRRSYQKKNEKV